MRLALTGGTGFVGGRLLGVARDAGHEVRALTRRPMPPRDGVEWVAGSLEDQASLERLCADADAVIHVAGAINARDEAGFEAGNVTGTAAMLAAAKSTGVPRFVHVSSLAAREPSLSRYGASKARSEVLVKVSDLSFAIVRPPAVYGPGDRETLELFKMAKRGLIALPPAARLSLIHADDLATLLIVLGGSDAQGLTVEPDDGHPGGYSHREFAALLGRAVGSNPVSLAMPKQVLRTAAALDRLIRRDGAKLTPDRVAYFCHPDWVADPGKAAPTDLWNPRIDTAEGLKTTADWYRAEGWL
ncbi:MAG TPA: NAD-dependent epimerase/dehydratase family protein [Sphingomicrobium sp.]|nr:NAD-dependent epimerase/dehydratase family protein [Sphingomicrobium sp.]